jgi:hypothetical protein
LYVSAAAAVAVKAVEIASFGYGVNGILKIVGNRHKTNAVSTFIITTTPG